ncbi:MAG: glycosyltransferase family 39 protein, partial [Alphaproteobacteria bacterium]|nr:glycosyltransferase family 39 protein [Alphaproteobacteria bacterium]
MFMVSALIFFVLNNHSLLHLDEMATMLEMRMPLKEMLNFLFTEDVHPPVYYILLKIWLLFFGDSVFAARVFSYLGVLACAFGGGFMVKKLYGERAGVWYTALFLFLPASFWLFREIRMYSWACFFCTMAFLFAQAALLKGEKKDFVLYVVYAFLGAWTHYYASLTCALIAVAYLVLSFKKNKTIFKKFFLANTVLFLIVCPQIYVLSHQNLGETTWISDKSVFNAYHAYFCQSVFLDFGAFSKMSAFVFSCLWFSGLQALLGGQKNDEKTVSKTGVFIALSVWYITFFASIVYRPVLIDRYLTLTLGSLYIFFVFGIIDDRRNEIILGVFLFLSVVFSFNSEIKKSIQNPQPLFYQAIKENVTANDVIIENDWRIRMWLYYQFPDYDVRTVEGKRPVNFFNKKKRLIDIKEIPQLLKEKNIFIT